MNEQFVPTNDGNEDDAMYSVCEAIVLAIHEGDREKAMEIAEQACLAVSEEGQASRLAEMQYMVGMACHFSGVYDAAERFYEQALAQEVDEAGLRASLTSRLGWLHWDLGDSVRAAESWQSVLTHDDALGVDRGSALFGLGCVEVHRGHGAQAFDYFVDVLGCVDPTDPLVLRVRVELGELYLRLGDAQLCLASFVQALSHPAASDADKATISSRLAELAREMDQLRLAATLYQNAASLIPVEDPSHFEAWYRAAELLGEEGQQDVAAGLVQELLTKQADMYADDDPQRLVGQRRAALVLLSLERFEAGFTILADVMALEDQQIEEQLPALPPSERVELLAGRMTYLGVLTRLAATVAPDSTPIAGEMLAALRRLKTLVRRHLDRESQLSVLLPWTADAQELQPLETPLPLEKAQRLTLRALSLFVPTLSDTLIDVIKGAALPQDDDATTESEAESEDHYYAFVAVSSDSNATRLIDLGAAEGIEPVLATSCVDALRRSEPDMATAWPAWSNVTEHVGTVH